MTNRENPPAAVETHYLGMDSQVLRRLRFLFVAISKIFRICAALGRVLHLQLPMIVIKIFFELPRALEQRIAVATDLTLTAI